MIVTQRVAGFDEPREIRRLQRGDYFGEKALLRYHPPTSSSLVTIIIIIIIIIGSIIVIISIRISINISITHHHQAYHY